MLDNARHRHRDHRHGPRSSTPRPSRSRAGEDRLIVTRRDDRDQHRRRTGAPGHPRSPREQVHALTSTDLIRRPNCPPDMAILGGGYLGMEFAGMYRPVRLRGHGARGRPRILPPRGRRHRRGRRRHPRGRGHRPSSPARGHADHGRRRPTPRSIYEIDGRRHTLEADASSPPPAARPRPRASAWTPPAYAPPRRAPSRSTSTCAPASRTSSRSATSTAARSSPTSPSTTAASSPTSSSATERARRRTAAVPYTLFMTPPLSRVGLTETRGTRKRACR